MRNDPSLHEFRTDLNLDLDGLDRSVLESMAEAGQEIVEIYRVLAITGDNLVGELIKGHETFYEWDHYPPGDVYDRETHGQYYFHTHPVEERFDDEHGHFHTFIRPRGMPPGVKPAPVPGYQAPDDPDDALSHLIAIAMDNKGFPFRLFTVNRWVTGEVWYTAQDVKTLLEYFKIGHTQPSWPVNRWISAMICLFKPQIVALLDARDAAASNWAKRHQDRDIYEDRDLEVTSFTDVSVEDQVRAVAGALLARS